MDLIFKNNLRIIKMNSLVYKVLIMLFATTILQGTDLIPFLGDSIRGDRLKELSHSLKPTQKKESMSGFLAKEAKKAEEAIRNKTLAEKKKKEKQKKIKYQMMKKKR